MDEINLYDLIKYYVKKWPLIVGLTLLGLLAGLVYNYYIQTPLYKSEATLFLVSSDDQLRTQDATLINNYVELFESRRVLLPVIEEQGLDMTYKEVIEATEVTAEKETDVIKLSFASPTPKTSQDFLAGAVRSFQQQSNNLYELNNVQIVDEANLSNVPYNVRQGLQLALASAAGFMLAIVTLFFIYDIKVGRFTSRAAIHPKIKPKKNTYRQDEVRRGLLVKNDTESNVDSESEKKFQQNSQSVVAASDETARKAKKAKKKRSSSRNHNLAKPRNHS